MSQAYSNPERESDPYALPDVEVFYSEHGDCIGPAETAEDNHVEGWYYWYCFPGCMPDSDPIGQFATEAEALAAAQDDDQ